MPMDKPFKSLNDQLLEDCKSVPLSGNLPFPSWGSGYGSSQIFRSEQHWDAYIDSQTGFSASRSVEQYQQQLGDPLDNSLVAAACRFLGDAIPEAPLVVKKRQDVNKDGTTEKSESIPVPDHKLTKLWDRPNDSYQGVQLKKGLALSLVLSGNAYVIKFFDNMGFNPLELWWEPHWSIRPVWPIDGSSFIAYYEVNRGGIWYPVPVEQVIHIRDGIHPYNQRLGWSGNRAVSRELFGDQEAGAYYATLMGGSGVPGFAISIDASRQGVTQTDIDALDRRMAEKTRGSKKGQPLVLYGARPYKLGFNPRELDLRESRYMAEDRFCAVQGIPAVVLELGTGNVHSIYKNVSEAQKRAWRNYVCPKLTLIEETLNFQLLEDFEGKDSGMYCRHDLAQVEALQEESDAKEKRMSHLYTSGGIMRSELRASMGYGPSNPDDPEADRVWAKMSADEQAARADEKAKEALKLAETQAKNPVNKLVNGVNLPGSITPPKGGKLALVKKAPMKSAQDLITWVDFPEYFGSLGIPRTSMPQVLSAHRGAMVQFLKGRGISNRKENVLPGALRPSQKEYSPEKVAKAKVWEGPQRPLLVSDDGYVADGHHQWAAALEADPMTEIPIFRLGANIVELLLEIARFPSSGVATADDKRLFWNGNGVATKAIPGMRSEFTDILPNCEVKLDDMDVVLALLATDRILTFASEFPKPASLLREVTMEPNERETNLAYVRLLDDGNYRMVFNSSLWTDPTIMQAALTETIGNDDISTFPVDTVESTIDHELAHVLDGWTKQNKNGNAEVSSDNPVWATEDALNISRYSVAGPAEAFAEAFAIRQLFGIEKIPAGEIRQSMESTISFAAEA